MDEAGDHRPLLVVVTGPPASGKSTVAGAIARALRLPLLTKDGIKETLFDVLGTGDRDWSKRLGETSWRVLFNVLAVVLEGGCSLVAEGNFEPDYANRQFAELPSLRGVQVYCDAPADELLDRVRERSESATGTRAIARATEPSGSSSTRMPKAAGARSTCPGSSSGTAATTIRPTSSRASEACSRAKVIPVDDRSQTWGIEPVPDRLRVLGGLDTGLLWGNLGVSLLVVVAGAVLVPALSLPDALLAIVVGSAIGCAMLGAAAGIGAQARVPAMVLMRAPLGEQGSYLPTALNVAQTLGWTVFELLVIATAAAALSDELFGFQAQWAWTLVFGTFALALGLAGPIGFVRRYVRKIAVWAVPAALVYLVWWTLDGADLGALWDQPGEGGLTTWQGADIVVGITVSWVPLAADYTRFSRSPRAALWGTGAGYMVPNVLLLVLGSILVLSRELTDPAGLPAAVAAGGVVALLALLALTAGETDEVFANAYSAAVSLQNLFPELPIRLLVTLTTVAGTTGALTIELVSYQTFLLLLGSFFVPLFGVLLGHWVVAGRRYEPEDVFGAPGWRPGLIGAWVAGFALYQWLFPTGPSRWVEQVERLNPPDWGIGATVPSFLVSFALAVAVAALQRRVSPAAAT